MFSCGCNMKKIHVQNKIPTREQAILISRFLILVVILLITILCFYFHVLIRNIEILIPAVTFIIILLAYAIILMEETHKESKEYVYELRITERDLAIVYKKDAEISKITKINLDNIKSFHAELTANNLAPNHPLHLECSTDVVIETKDHESIHFTEIPTTVCKYSFMLRLLAISQDLPNFTFHIEGNSKTTRKDVEHFAKYGKRLHWLEISYLVFKELSIINKICFIFLLSFIIFFIQLILLGLLSLLI